MTSSNGAAQPDPTAPGPAAPDTTAPQSTEKPVRRDDPLRGSRTSGFWSFVIVLALVLLLLAIFIFQNTQKVQITFLGWSGQSPLAASLLIAAVAGALVVALAGALRILQLRRRVKRANKR